MKQKVKDDLAAAFVALFLVTIGIVFGSYLSSTRAQHKYLIATAERYFAERDYYTAEYERLKWEMKESKR